MKNKRLIILIVLGIAAVFSLIYGIVTPPKRKQRALSKQEVVHQDERVQLVGRIVLMKRRAKKTKFASWGRNPFSPSAPIKTFKGLTLNGILWDKERPMAIINDIIIEIGGEVSGNTIVDIKQDRVILNDGIRDFELRLGR